MADLAHDSEVVADEDHGETELFLQLDQKVHDLRLHRHVEGGNRLVADDQLRFQDHRTGNADALLLSAGEPLAGRFTCPASSPTRASKAQAFSCTGFG